MKRAMLPAALLLLLATRVVAQPRGEDEEEDERLQALVGLVEFAELPKHALVIGNEHYVALPRVTNAINDAKAMEGALGREFEVDAGADLGRDAFLTRLDEFVGRALAVSAPGTAVVAFYFAGHGFRMGSENFLVPVDLGVNDIDQKSIALSHIVERVTSRRVALAIFFLDACRTELLSAGLNISVSFVEPQGGGHGRVYYAFASEFGTPSKSTVTPNDVNSPFVTALVPGLSNSSDIELRDFFDQVRLVVLDATHRSQTPTDHKGDRFLGKHYFHPADQRVRALKAELLLAYTDAGAARPPNDPACFIRRYLDLYPTSPYSTAARTWLLQIGGPAAEEGPGCS